MSEQTMNNGSFTICRPLYVCSLLLISLGLTACATGGGIDQRKSANQNKLNQQVHVTSSEPVENLDDYTAGDDEPVAQGPQFYETPRAPDMGSVKSATPPDPMKSRLSREKVAVNFREMPVAKFINEVFGNILGVNFEIADTLNSRQDLVTVRAADPQTHYELYLLAKQVLQSYGIATIQQDNLLRFTLASDESATTKPLILSGRALPDVPYSHRPVFQIVPLKYVRDSSVKTWIETAFDSTGLTVTSDSTNNVVILQGPPQIVSEALSTIDLLDRPNMRGRYSVRIAPSFVSAAVLSKMLIDVLESEGIAAVEKPPFGAIIILPMLPTNSVIAFSGDKALLDHVKEWASELDQPPDQDASSDYFYYQVQNTSASELAAVLRGVESGDTGGDENKANSDKGIPGVFVDKNRNGLIFTGNSGRWKNLVPIIKAMDRPARLVSVEVTVASVSLTDDDDLGVEWLFNDPKGRYSGVGATNFGLGSSGFSYALSNAGQVRFALNALSQNQRVSILSKPSILVKSGDVASIDVGQEVPIITSQAQSTDAGSAPVLQNIQYRKTGVLLEVSPLVHSGNLVDLGIIQEVSEVLDSAGSGVDSPSIFNRRVQTMLTLSDGGAVVLGGLISGSSNKGKSKVPFLGDIPGIGALFRSSGNQEQRSELILIIQAYIIDINEKKWTFNEELERRLKLLDVDALEMTP